MLTCKGPRGTIVILITQTFIWNYKWNKTSFSINLFTKQDNEWSEMSSLFLRNKIKCFIKLKHLSILQQSVDFLFSPLQKGFKWVQLKKNNTNQSLIQLGGMPLFMIHCTCFLKIEGIHNFHTNLLRYKGNNMTNLLSHHNVLTLNRNLRTNFQLLNEETNGQLKIQAKGKQLYIFVY